MTALLRVRAVWAGYGRGDVLREFSLEVEAGETVAVIGPNGAGKTTFFRAVSGLLRPSRGTILFDGEAIEGRPAHRIARAGIAHVPQGRNLFGGLTVRENLLAGGYLLSGRGEAEARIAELAESFPIVAERSDALARTLSGGQQQMVAIARGLATRPRLLMLDEPSLGLAPAVLDTVAALIAGLKARGQTVLLAEQNVPLALSLADRVHVISEGRVVASGAPGEMRNHPQVQRAYFGRAAEARPAGG